MKTTAKTLSTYSFMSLFPTEKEAREFIEKQLWNNQPFCPICGSVKVYPRKDRAGYRCGDCTKDFTVRSGTIFENSRLPLHKWLYAMYLIVTSRKGISSLQLSKELGITQKSAWFLLQRIREACNDDTSMLEGIIEIDETYIGGLEKNKHEFKKTPNTQGRSTKTKTAIVGLKQRGGKVKAKVFNIVDSKHIQTFIDENIKKGSILSTDEARIYKPIKNYQKLIVNHSIKEFVNGLASTNGIESVWAILKRAYYGTFHHFTTKHINRYINEFTFRLNDGNCSIDTIDRISSLVIGTNGKYLSYKGLIDG